jgi:hypothetical protein
VLVNADMTVDHLTVRHAKWHGIRVLNAALTLQNSLIQNTGNVGLWVDAGSATIVDSAIIRAATGVQIDPGQSATASGSAFESFSNLAVNHLNATSDANAIFTGNWWGDPAGPHDPSAADGIQNINPGGAPVSDYVRYVDYLTTRPPLAVGPFVTQVTPTISNEPIASVEVRFSDEIDLATFTVDDLTLSGPQSTAIAAIEAIDALRYRITFATPLTADGNYTLTIGPSITSASSGYLLDQDRDGQDGESVDDVFVATLRVDRAGPRVVSHSPNGTVAIPVSFIDIEFNEAIRPTSLTAADLQLTTPTGSVQVLGVTRLSDTTYRIHFPVQFNNGQYTLTVLPDITDMAGNMLDQDRDGLGGETEEDQYAGSFTIQRNPFRIISQTPQDIFPAPANFVEVTFSAPVNASTFTADDVRFVGPGPVQVTSVTALSPTRIRIDFETITREGEYTLRIGPAIADQAGFFMDQDQNSRPGEISDVYVSTFRVDNAGPFVSSVSPVGTVPAPVSEIIVRFSEPIDSATFSATDIVMVGPNGTIPVLSVTLQQDGSYRVAFVPQTDGGNYSITIGPQLRDEAGVLMDQDRDGVAGEPAQDQFQASFRIDTDGASVVSATPSDDVTQPFNNIIVEFDEPVLASSFTADDVILTNPQGTPVPVTISRINDLRYRINFATQDLAGRFDLHLGPDIFDLTGNGMNQDGDLVSGEPEDAYSLAFELLLPNLVIDQVVVPTSVANGELLQVQWRVTNAGTAVANLPWTNAAVLSRDAFLGGNDDTVLWNAASGVALAPGESVTLQGEATVPFGIVGQFPVIIRVDRNNQVVSQTTRWCG